MVPSIARQSVIIKCNMQTSVLTGNYEYYYAAGLLTKLYGVQIPDEIEPLELEMILKEKQKEISPKDEKETYLTQMIFSYKPFAEYDEQMRELLLLGKNEEYLWMVVIPS